MKVMVQDKATPFYGPRCINETIKSKMKMTNFTPQ